MSRSNDGGHRMDRRGVLAIGGAAAAASLVTVTATAKPANLKNGHSAIPALRKGARALPSTFLWGVSTSGHQIEGNNTNADSWLMENVKPTIFEERSGDACDSFNRYRQDIDLLQALGFNSYRFSLEWSRIEPNEGYFSNAALDHYKRMIAYCHAVGIRPCVTFNHYTTPIWFAASGGFLRSDGPDIFARFCQKAAQHLADGMHYAFTLNEPEASRIVDLVFGDQIRAPTAAMAAAAAKAVGSTRFETWKTSDPDALLEPLIEAHKRGYAAIKSVRSDLPTGVSLATIDFRPAGPKSAVSAVREKIDGAWLEAAKTGDFVGIQNYFPVASVNVV